MGEDGNVSSGSKKAGVSGNAAKHAGILVLNLTLDDAVAEGSIVNGRHNAVAPVLRRVKGSVRHAERTENFALAEDIDRFVGQALECNSKDDETNVAVFRACTGIRGELSFKCGGQQLVASLGAKKELLICGQPRTVGKQHMQRHLIPVRIVARKFRDYGADGHFEIEQSTLIKTHRHR